MKTKKITAYFCDHCNKLYRRKHAAIYHEKMCKNNPENDRPCFRCDHLTIKDTTICYDNGPAVPDEVKVNFYYCDKLKHFLHNPQSEIKGNAIDLGDELNEPMPKKCGYNLIDKVPVLVSNGIVSKEEFSDFKQLALGDVDVAEQVYNGFDNRKKPDNYSPFF